MLKSKSINFIHFQIIDSTNTWTKENASHLDSQQITCVTAKEQTKGRGRFFRKWVSPPGQNIYATLYFCIPKTFPYLPNLGQILCISLAQVLLQKNLSPQIKWPNDLLLDGKKVAGVLCETVSFEDHLGVVLGIGINVNMPPELLEQIDQPATSLMQSSGHSWSLDVLLQSLIQQFLNDFETLQKQGFSYFQAFYETLLAFKGEIITLKDGQSSLQGVCHSITQDGKLNLQLSNGQFIAIYAGEIKPYD